MRPPDQILARGRDRNDAAHGVTAHRRDRASRRGTAAPPLDWLILGGGVHGVHVATRLLGEGGVSSQTLRIVDPAPVLLARWRACTAVTGMTHLRSPAVHHVDVRPLSLRHFVGGRKRPRRRGLFAAPFARPSLPLFDAHCDHVIRTYGLDDLHVPARASTCVVGGRTVAVELSDGRVLEARRIVLALGTSEQPRWPDWADPAHPRVHHIFQPNFDGWPADRGERVAVIGGGISALQTALRLAREGHHATVVCRHPLRQQQFDSDRAWLGPKRMLAFHRERDPDRRRALIDEARPGGSAPPEVIRAFRRAVARREVTWRRQGIVDVGYGADEVFLRLEGAPDVFGFDRVLLATGFSPARPGGAMVDHLIASASLPCARCGYPVVDWALRWHPRVHVTGPLAELELGPTARNIAGARRAGARLTAFLRARSAATTA
ncbi:MAG: FAD/NAD(P)-binding protein [Myxococcota bacterium]